MKLVEKCLIHATDEPTPARTAARTRAAAVKPRPPSAPADSADRGPPVLHRAPHRQELLQMILRSEKRRRARQEAERS